jgi:hypothetical protein
MDYLLAPSAKLLLPAYTPPFYTELSAGTGAALSPYAQLNLVDQQKLVLALDGM